MPSYAATQVLHPIYTTPSLGSTALRKTCEGIKALATQCVHSRRRRHGYQSLPEADEKNRQAVASRPITKAARKPTQKSTREGRQMREQGEVDERTVLLHERAERKFRALETILERDGEPEWSDGC